MKVLFVRPYPSSETIGLQHLMIVEPLELEVLATLIMDKYDVRIVDMILEKENIGYFINEYDPDVLCVTGYITHIPVIIDYCKEAKQIKPEIVTITGGVHCELFPEDINHESIDYRVIRNATKTFPVLIDHISGMVDMPKGVLKTNQNLNGSTLPDFDFYYPQPDRSLTNKYRKKYFYVFHDKVALIKTSFGCPFKCKFCFCRKITGDNYYARPLSEVIDELLSIKEDEIYIVDDDFLLNKERIHQFIDLLKEKNLKKKFLVYGRADFIASNPDLIKEFKNVGLRTIIVGLESFEDAELNEFNKLTSSNINKQAMAVMNQNNVDCYAAVIISPSWKQEDFKKAGDIMLDLGIKFVNLQPLTPLKGTGLLDKEESLIIERDDYAKWDLAHVSLRPDNMSVQDFYMNILHLYQRIVLNPKNLYRHLKYPLSMHFKMIKGIIKVKKQYQNKIMEVAANA